MFRNSKKEKSYFYSLAEEHTDFCISVVTYYEVMAGSSVKQDTFWKEFLAKVAILDFDLSSAIHAVTIYKELRRENRLIDLADIFIAAT